MENTKENIKKEFQLGNVKVELSKEDLESMLKEIDKPEFDYPICCKLKNSEMVVLFHKLKEATVLKEAEKSVLKVGTLIRIFEPHTDKETWEEIPYDQERGLYHGQWVYCWDNINIYGAVLRKYDVNNKCAFTAKGKENGGVWDNYSATCPEHMKEAFTDLLNNEKALGFLKD